MSKMRKLLAGGLLAGILLAGGATAAHAGTSYVNYTAIMPRFQQATYIGPQTKTYTNTASNLQIYSVGSTYTANAKTQNSAGAQGAELKGLDQGTYNLGWANPSVAGTNAWLVMTCNTWTTVDVAASIAWRSN